MKTRVITAAVCVALLLLLLLLTIWFGSWTLFTVAIAALCFGEAVEFTRCAAPNAPRSLRNTSVYFAVLIPYIGFQAKTSYAADDASFYASFYIVSAFALLIILFALYIFYMERGGNKITLRDMLCAFYAGFIFPVMFSSLIRLGVSGGVTLVLLPIIITVTCDSGAYFTGIFLGKHKLCPAVSPKKTIEGSIGGFVCGIGCTLLYAFILRKLGYEVSYIKYASVGSVGSIFCQFGDLCYSAIKREFGIKDYGKLFPGHGGVLDRFDSMSFVAPAAELMLITMGIL